MHKLIKSLVLLSTIALLQSACSGDPDPGDHTAPDAFKPVVEEAATTQPPQSTQTPQPQAGPGEVAITGATTLTYSPINKIVTYIGGQYEIFLQLQTDDPNLPSGVRIFLPEGTAVGSYDMVSLLDLEDGVSARFDYSNGGVLDYFEGTDGRLELIEAGDSYSGSFTFNAVDPRDQARFISVAGNFEDALPAQ